MFSHGHFLPFTGNFLATEITATNEILPVPPHQGGGRGGENPVDYLAGVRRKDLELFGPIFPLLFDFNQIYQLFLSKICPDKYSRSVLLGGQAGNCQQVGYKNILELSVLGSFSTPGFPNKALLCTSRVRDLNTRILLLTSFSLKSLVAAHGFPI